MAHNKHIYLESDATPSPKLGANERALLDQIPVPLLRHIAERIVLLKMKFQFSGWLQYVLPLFLAVVIFLIAGFIRLFGIESVANLIGILGLIVLAIFVFDLVTVKFRLRFPERLPQRNDELDLFDLMRTRRSCRSFQTRKLTPDDYNALMESVGRHSEAPTIGQSPVRFEYISAPLTVWPTVNATEFIVAIAPKEYDRLAVMDVGRSLQKIVTDATRMGLATCWIGPGADPSSIAVELGDRFNPNEDHIICVCAMGYKSSYIPLFLRIFNRQFYQRLPLSELFFADSQFQQPLNVDAYPFDQFGRNFEICQWAPSSYNGQTTRCVAVMEPDAEKGEHDEARLVRFDFYTNTESRYYAVVALGIWCANWELGCAAQGIHGHFALPDTQNLKDRPQLPHYDVSWVLDDSI